MERIKLHLAGVAVLLPCLMLFSEFNVAVNLLGICYVCTLFVLSDTDAGKRFLRRYYHEILRLENTL